MYLFLLYESLMHISYQMWWTKITVQLSIGDKIYWMTFIFNFTWKKSQHNLHLEVNHT